MFSHIKAAGFHAVPFKQALSDIVLLHHCITVDKQPALHSVRNINVLSISVLNSLTVGGFFEGFIEVNQAWNI